jgi:hypothetical protein
MTTKITQMGIGDIMERLRENPTPVFKDAYENGMNLSGWLERLNPTDKNDSLDAFGRLMKEAGIVRRSDPATGYWASPAEDFLKDKGSRALLIEFASRTWRDVAYSGGNRATYLSGDGTPGSWQRPYADAQAARWDEEIAPAIPLSALVGMTSPINGDAYRAFYLTYDATQLRMFRTGESAEIPIAKLADAENTIILHKYGRGLRASYEQLRRMRVDKLAMQIRVMAVQSEVDKVAAALYIIVNGDGNSNTSATSYNLTTLDADATAGTLTLKGWLNFRKQLANPYILNIAIMQAAVALQLELLNMGSANVPLIQLQGNPIVGTITPINTTAGGVGYGWTSDAPALTIVGIDRRMNLEQVVEIGSSIAETDRFITNQTEVMTMTEVQGFAVMDANAAIVMDVNA